MAIEKETFRSGDIQPSVELTNMVMVTDETTGRVLVQERVKSWKGLSFPGGHVEPGESFVDSAVREIKEETGLVLNSFSFRGIVTFLSDDDPAEYMCLYTSDDFSGNLIECDEGNLEWIKKSDFKNLEHWEGDLIFLDLLEKNEPFFSLKLIYRIGTLKEAVLNGKKIR